MSDGKITLTIDGQVRELEANYLSPVGLEYWQAWLLHYARLAYNPLVEFADKIQALPVDLRESATRTFVSGLDWNAVPKLIVLQTIHSLAAMNILGNMVLGQDVITATNWEEAFPLLLPFLQRQEYVASSMEEANAIRAKLGKPPLGRPLTASPPQGG